jgi:hypothetical protein
VASSRWVNIKSGGEIIGQGTIKGDVYNQGTLSPGRTADATGLPNAPPPARPASNLSTGVVSAIAFNFSGIQDDVPIGQTSAQSQYLELTHGLDFGPSIGPRWGGGGTNQGNELNTIGENASSLAQAINNGDYITFTVNPVAGAGIIPSTVSFNLWRNGNAAAQNFAILSSVSGFNTSAILAQANYAEIGSTSNQHTLSANIPTVADALTAPIEYRLYAWGASAATGNTHVTAASMTAKFVATPTLEFNFSGVQNQTPLTSLKRQDASITLVSGLNYGSGLNASTNNNAGNELNVAGFTVGGTQQAAVTANDYMTFTVQPIAGMAMYTDSVHFTLWRQGAGSATDYAVFSSISGFAAGNQLAQAHVPTTGSANQLSLGGSFISPQATTDPVEFRLYGWGATTASDNTHLVAAAMQARFVSLVGATIDPTGSLSVQGDFYHQAGGQIAIDLGGHSAGVDYDTINVTGKANLAGNLSVALADVGGSPFAPASGDVFQILSATQGVTGQFANVTLPILPWDLNWHVNYLSNVVTLSVLVNGDFNHDGVVNNADYVVWRKNNGSQTDYNAWRSNFGNVVGSGSGSSLGGGNVPEPASLILIAMGAAVSGIFNRRRRLLH